VLEPTAFQVRLGGAKGVIAVWDRGVWADAAAAAREGGYMGVYMRGT